jgi:ferredoxin-NADP reductase
VSPSRPDDLPQNWVWAGAGRITPELLRSEIPDLESRRAFVSGPPAMVADLRSALKKIGLRRVTADYFSGY